MPALSSLCWKKALYFTRFKYDCYFKSHNTISLKFCFRYYWLSLWLYSMTADFLITVVQNPDILWSTSNYLFFYLVLQQFMRLKLLINNTSLIICTPDGFVFIKFIVLNQIPSKKVFKVEKWEKFLQILLRKSIHRVGQTFVVHIIQHTINSKLTERNYLQPQVCF